MKPLVVVENPKRWPFDMDQVEVVSAWDYLTDPAYADLRRAAVFNVCRRYGYQSTGYYVSLLAAARGHKPLPSVATLQNVGRTAVVRLVAEEVDELLQRTFQGLKSDEFRLNVYFGHSVAKRHARLARILFNQFPAPFLVARFNRVDGQWRMLGIRPVAAGEISEKHRAFVLDRAREYFRRPPRPTKGSEARYDLAVLWSPDDATAPSDEKAIRRFTRAAGRAGIQVHRVEADDYGRLAEFDALFIRETTQVNHHTYRFAQRAAAEGLVVIDDPESIIRSTNKVYQAELFRRHGIPCPETMVVHPGNRDEVSGRIGLPCVLKKPDGSFSTGVVKVEDEEELQEGLTTLFEESELVVAQAFTPSAWDWRVGVLGGRALYAARYHMARGHWQIVQNRGARPRYGRVEAMPLEEATPGVVETAVRAASHFGDGLYGVDLKDLDGRIVVMEVNDNPNLEAGYEDAVLGHALWDTLATWFRVRLDRRGEREAP